MSEPKDACEFLEALREENQQEHQDYTSLYQYLEPKARKNNVPLFGQFELTPLCNLSCKMCYVHLMPEQMQNRALLSVSEWKNLIDQAYAAGMLEATLTGGECLTYPGFDEIYLYLQELGCAVTVMSNAVLMDEKRIKFFEEHPPGLIQVTLYGASEEAYERVTGRRAYQTVLRNVERIKEAGIPLQLSITPNGYLGEDVFETIRVARSITDNVFVNTDLFVPTAEELKGKEIADLDAEFYVRILRFEQELDGKKPREIPESELPIPGGPCSACEEQGVECGGGKSSFVINWKGELCICNRLDVRAYPMRDGFQKAWKEISEVANHWPRVAACQGCAYEDVCPKCVARKMKCVKPGEQPLDLCRQTRYMVSRGILPVPHCETEK
jgi:radical SAM protein with 4Fe4S-binding SPASM domain